MKATRSFWHCRRALENKWGLSQKVMNCIYRIFVRPYISYASVVWWTKTHLKNIATSLSSLQKLACIGITIRIAPTAAFKVCLSLHPLPYFIEAEALCAAKKRGMWRTSGLHYGHSTILEKSQFTDPKVLMPSDHTAKTYHFNMRYKTLISNREG